VSAEWRFAPSAAETPRQRSRRIGKAKSVYDALRCDFPPHTDAAEDILSIMHGAEGRPPGASCGGGFLVAPIGVGKSETLKMAERAANADAVAGERPALRIEISVRGTTDSVPQAILTSFGAKRPDAGKESAQWARATDLMRQHQVRLLLIDEFNRAARRPTISSSIALSIQERIMDASICPVVFAGSEKADTVLRGAPSVRERLDDGIDLQPLLWEREADRELMTEFLAELDELMVDEGLLLHSANLAEGDVPKFLCRASRGKLRAIVKTVRSALVLALRRGAVTIAREDLAEGVQQYCIRQRLVGRNPFHDRATGGPAPQIDTTCQEAGDAEGMEEDEAIEEEDV